MTIRPTLAERSQRLNAAAAPHWPERRLPTAILMTDAQRLPDPLSAVRQLPRRAAVIVRHTDAAARRALARDLAPVCRQRAVLLLIANDWRLAARVGADGVHLAEAEVPRAGTAAWPVHWCVTAAAHSRAALWRAWRAGADAALLAPVFATRSHLNAPTLGAAQFAALAFDAPLPVYALGGIDADNARRLHGAVGIAAIAGLSAG